MNVDRQECLSYFIPARSGLIQNPHPKGAPPPRLSQSRLDRKSTRLNSSHLVISYAVFCLKKKIKTRRHSRTRDDGARQKIPQPIRGTSHSGNGWDKPLQTRESVHRRAAHASRLRYNGKLE